MKATIDFDGTLYRRLKVEAARRGQTIRELVAEGVRYVLDTPAPRAPQSSANAAPAWLGMLEPYAANADGKHNLSAVRASITRRRSGA